MSELVSECIVCVFCLVSECVSECVYCLLSEGMSECVSE